MARVFGRVFNLVNKSWHMYPVGFLFGLGFDNAVRFELQDARSRHGALPTAIRLSWYGVVSLLR